MTEPIHYGHRFDWMQRMELPSPINSAMGYAFLQLLAMEHGPVLIDYLPENSAEERFKVTLVNYSSGDPDDHDDLGFVMGESIHDAALMLAADVDEGPRSILELAASRMSASVDDRT